MRKLDLYALEGIPFIQKGDDIGAIICEVAQRELFSFKEGDIAVVTSKIVSKAEGRLVDTYKVRPSRKTIALARRLEMDPRKFEVILGETKRLLIARPGLVLTEDRLGFLSTSAGVDSSNTLPGPKGQIVSLLPKNPDLSARKIRRVIKRETGQKVAVIINDTFGRPDRRGSVGMAIGISGIAAVYSPPVKEDIHGKKRHPEIAQVDEIAAAASLIMGQTNEGRPVVIVRGVDFRPSKTDRIKTLLHPVAKYLQDARDALRSNDDDVGIAECDASAEERPFDDLSEVVVFLDERDAGNRRYGEGSVIYLGGSLLRTCARMCSRIRSYLCFSTMSQAVL